eukprot:jgi/Mesvir1/24229/Mv10939-RA.1
MAAIMLNCGISSSSGHIDARTTSIDLFARHVLKKRFSSVHIKSSRQGRAVSCSAKALPTPEEQQSALTTLKRTCETRKEEPAKVLQAMWDISRAKLASGNAALLSKVGGDKSPGHTWALVFTSGTKEVQDAMKNLAGGGSYFPLPARQRFDAEAKVIENGIYLGPLGSLVFSGNFTWSPKNNMLAFDFDDVKVKLGPLGPFKFGLKTHSEKGKGGVAGGKGPFFLINYCDDDILVAKGRGGGLAVWMRYKEPTSEA